MLGGADAIISPQTTGSPIPISIMQAQTVEAYSAGNDWPTFGPYCQARPDLARKGWITSITLTCVGKGRAYDIEPGGGQNSNIGTFMNVGADRTNGLPWLYTFASNGQAMLKTAEDFGYHQGQHFYYWSSHVGRGEHICAPDVCGYPKADGTQYEFLATFDLSVFNDYMFPAVGHSDAYAIFPLDVHDAALPRKGNERLVVEQTDGAFEHSVEYRNYLKGVLYGELKQFRDRIWRVSHFEPPEFVKPRAHADWGDDRGIRWQALNNRMKKIAHLP